MLSDVIRILIKENKDKDNFTNVKKLEKLLSRFKTFSFMNMAANGFFYLDQSIIDFLRDKSFKNSEEFSNLIKAIQNSPINPFAKLYIISKSYKKVLDYVNSMNSFSDKLKFFF